MKQKSYLLSLLALVLILTVSLQPALAYFTDSTQATGYVRLFLENETEITEGIDGLQKTVTIQNKEGSPVWIRATAYAGHNFNLKVSGWGDAYDGAGDGCPWFYYGSPVAENKETGSLIVLVTPPDSEDYPITSFNVGVQYESMTVQYNENGDPIWPDPDAWENNKLEGHTITS